MQFKLKTNYIQYVHQVLNQVLRIYKVVGKAQACTNAVVKMNNGCLPTTPDPVSDLVLSKTNSSFFHRGAPTPTVSTLGFGSFKKPD